jgi:hypothetical protein
MAKSKYLILMTVVDGAIVSLGPDAEHPDRLQLGVSDGGMGGGEDVAVDAQVLSDLHDLIKTVMDVSQETDNGRIIVTDGYIWFERHRGGFTLAVNGGGMINGQADLTAKDARQLRAQLARTVKKLPAA